MEENIFAVAMKAVSAVGTRDPFIIAEYLGILPIPISGTILGYAALYHERYPVIGLNTRLDPVWRMFGGWHEIGHVLYGDVFDKALQKRGIFDTGFFLQEVDSKTIACHEKRANLLSADVCLSDEDVAEVTRYNSSLMQAYRRLVMNQERLVTAYEQLRFSVQQKDPSTLMQTRIKAYRDNLRKLEEKKNDIESEMMAMNCCKSFSQMAAELGTTETILRYKLEAMRLRGEDIDRQELEHYDQVFKGVL